ncbi:MAG: glycosyltransferase family A protein [Planctomycetota bacterium]
MSPISPSRLSLVTLTTRPEEFGRTASTLEEQHIPVEVQRLPIDANGNGWNAAQGLNHGIDQSEGDWVVCAHQDVLFPPGWWGRVLEQIQDWQGNIGAIGLVGVEPSGSFRGHIIDPHGHCYWGPLPAPVSAFDEHVIVLRADAKLRFDPETPHFHCYGTDIALSARAAGLDALAVDAPVVHLSGGTLDPKYFESGEWLMRKWKRSVLPTCASILHSGSLLALPAYLRAKLARRASRKARHGHDGRFRAAYGISTR